MRGWLGYQTPSTGTDTTAIAFRNPEPYQPWLPENGSVTKDTSATTCSHPSKNPNTATYWNGKKSSTNKSTKSVTLSSKSSPTSKPGASCTLTTDAPSKPSKKQSPPSSHYTFIP